MSLRSILLVFLSVLCATVLMLSRASSADISIIREEIFAEQDMPPAGCNVVLKGTIEPGDLAKLKSAYRVAQQGGKYTPSYLCLDSAGGSFTEAVDILHWLIDRETAISTVVEKGMSCMSACALVFMGGSEFIHLGRQPRRWLHVEGQLGFHAPYLESSSLPQKQFDVAEVISTFDAAMASARRLLTEFSRLREQVDQGPFPEPWVKASLFNELLLRGPSQSLLIDTIDRAGQWEIDLYGWRPIRTINEAQARNACRNVVAWIGDRSATELHASEARGWYVMEPLKQGPTSDPRWGRTSYEFWVNYRQSAPCTMEYEANAAGIVTGAWASFAGGGSFGGVNRAWIVLPSATKLKSLAASSPSTRRGGTTPMSTFLLRSWNNHALEGDDLRLIKYIDRQACASACVTNRACVGYTYDKWNRWCFLKASLGTLRFDPKYLSASTSSSVRRSTAPLKIERYRGKAFTKGSVRFATVPSFRACGQRCKADSSCSAFTYLKDSHHCVWYEDPGEYSSDSTADIGIKRQAPSR